MRVGCGLRRLLETARTKGWCDIPDTHKQIRWEDNNTHKERQAQEDKGVRSARNVILYCGFHIVPPYWKGILRKDEWKKTQKRRETPLFCSPRGGERKKRLSRDAKAFVRELVQPKPAVCESACT